jgi:hypothetical protein
MFTLNSIPCRTPAGFLSPDSILGRPLLDPTYLHPFGCLVWHKVPEASRKKLDVKGCSGMLLLYLQDGNGYRVWDLQCRTVFKTWDVLFVDTDFPYDTPLMEATKQSQMRVSACYYVRANLTKVT